ncbi:MAG TPA: histidine phosphatase family protein [Solirubrobacteraceae bacterium]
MTRSYPQRRFELPADATEVILVRHGASEPAVPGVPFAVRDGHADPALADPRGVEPARRAAARLAGEEIHALFTTGLTRTEQTAAPIADATGLAAQAEQRLREVHLGEWEGGEFRIRMQSGDPAALRVLTEQRWDVIPGAEPTADFAARVKAGFEEVVRATGAGRRAVAVVHGGVIGELCREATDSRPFAFVHAENCSISRVVVFGTGHWLLRVFNETTHLSAA